MYYSVDSRHALGTLYKLPSGQLYHRHIMLIASSLEDLETARHQSLEDTIRVILLRNGLQLLVVLRPVAGKDLLEASGVAPVSVSTYTPKKLYRKETHM